MPSSPSAGHPAEHAVAIEAVLPIGLPDVRRDLARGPFADRLLEQLLFVGQVEADHSEPEIVSRDAAPARAWHLRTRVACTAPDAHGGAAPARSAAALAPLAAISR